MSGLRFATAAALALLAASATHALAAPVVVAFRGFASGTIYTNDVRTVTYTNALMGGYLVYDPATGNDASGVGFSKTYGGVVLGPGLTNDPVSEAFFVVKGVQSSLFYTFIDGDGFFGSAENDYAIGQAVYQADTDSSLDSYIHFSLSSPEITSDLEAPFHATAGTGEFNNEYLFQDGPFLLSSGTFVITEAYVGRDVPREFGAVPEPASWALMILGFGTVGATLRRRRLATAA